MHSYTFPYKEWRIFKDLEGVLGGGKGGWRFMKTRGFRFLNPGFRNLTKISRTGRARRISQAFNNSEIRGDHHYERGSKEKRTG